jgi:hypothetical protein
MELAPIVEEKADRMCVDAEMKLLDESYDLQCYRIPALQVMLVS